MAHDVDLQLPERRARLEPELGHQRLAPEPIGREGVGLAAAAMEREHQLRPEALAQRMLGDEPLELGDRAQPLLELGVHQVLQRRHAQLLEPRDVGLRERVERAIRQRGPAPQRQDPPQRGGRFARPAGGQGATCVIHPRLEHRSVERTGSDAEHVARGGGDERTRFACAERRSQPRDVHLKRVRGTGRQVVAPQLVDQALRGHHLVGAQQQHEQQGAEPSTAHRDGLPVATDVERTEDREFDGH